MAELGGYADSWDLDVALKLDIEEMITQLSPYDAPFLGTYNGLENTPVPSVLPQGTVSQVKYEWLEDELLTPRSKVNVAYVAGGGSFTLPAGEASRFQPDDLVRVKSTAGAYLQYRVTAVNYDTDVLTVSIWDGTDAGISAGALLEGVGTLPVEGADPTESRMTDRSRLYNYTQIFGPYPVEMSETEQVISKYGVSSEWAHQTAKRVKESIIALEQAILYGTRKIDATGKRRSMGGLDYWISTANGSTVDTTTTSLDPDTNANAEDNLLTLQQNCYSKGGDPRLVVVGPDNKPDISEWRKSDIRFQLSENRRGQVITSFESDFGVVNILMHRWVRPSDLFLFNPEQAEVSTLVNRGLKWVKTAKTGDRDQAYVISERGFKFRGAKHAAKMTALAP